ncbi:MULTISPECIES: hypothetical protein [Legionella]|uniref:hypothetical protein n=1 Tax=Legionella TaxID=445 RepID=UPI000F8E9F3D|nr:MULTISPECIES: hypothetical protein [Legionella]MCP0912773.1 hypothetical protein [Legionella sp. 27cVA30]RUQ97057.1 hypothetical protein ELY11_06865 [Legionella septentrionalis]RUR16333.1 hypothetical protein ELY10_03835 [Legionella septentrionalis]
MPNLPRNIILAMGTDKTSLDAARSLAKQLPNAEIRLFNADCLIGLSSEEIANLTAVGHAHRGAYGAEGFSAETFVEELSTAIDKANREKDPGDALLQKTDIQRMRCIGCEVGFVDEDGLSYAQKLANAFAAEGYENLKLSALSNKNTAIPLENMYVSINPDGSACIKADKEDFHSSIPRQQRVELAKEIVDLRKKLDFGQLVLGFFGASKLCKEIEQKIKQFKELDETLKENFIQIGEEKSPITALDSNEIYQFPPKFSPEYIEYLENKLSRFRVEIEYDEEQIKHTTSVGMRRVLEEHLSHCRAEAAPLENKLAYAYQHQKVEDITHQVGFVGIAEKTNDSTEQGLDDFEISLNSRQDKKAVGWWQAIKNWFTDMLTSHSKEEEFAVLNIPSAVAAREKFERPIEVTSGVNEANLTQMEAKKEQHIEQKNSSATFSWKDTPPAKGLNNINGERQSQVDLKASLKEMKQEDRKKVAEPELEQQSVLQMK